MAYRVEIKASARKTNGAVGETVLERGPIRWFSDREIADDWARELSADGERTVWIQAAPPHATGPTDGYLVGRSRRRSAAAPFESEQRELSSATE